MSLNDDINLGAITEALNNKVDRDADNLSTAGQKVFDGAFVSSGLEICANVSGTADATYSLASYLPNDGYDYEILLIGLNHTGTTAGNYATIVVQSDIVNKSMSTFQNGVILGATRTREANYVEGGGSCWLPVGTGRYVKYLTTQSGTVWLAVAGYRRIGTNS